MRSSVFTALCVNSETNEGVTNLKKLNQGCILQSCANFSKLQYFQTFQNYNIFKLFKITIFSNFSKLKYLKHNWRNS